MNIPNRVKIKAGIWYNVVYQDVIPSGDSKHETLGLCDPNSRTITISLNQSETSKQITFIHEVLHCLEAERDIKIPHKVVNQLDYAIYQLLKLNKII